jgi:hypothetical protein
MVPIDIILSEDNMDKVNKHRRLLAGLLGVGGRLTVTIRLLRKVLSHSESGSCANR